MEQYPVAVPATGHEDVRFHVDKIQLLPVDEHDEDPDVGLPPGAATSTVEP